MKKLVLLSLSLIFFSYSLYSNEYFGIITRIEKNRVYINLSEDEGIEKDTEFNIYRKEKIDEDWIERFIGKAWVVDFLPEVCLAYAPKFEQIENIKIGDRVKKAVRAVDNFQVPLPNGDYKKIEPGNKVRSFVVTRSELSTEPVLIPTRADTSRYLIGKVAGIKNDYILVSMLPLVEKGRMVKIVRKAAEIIHPVTNKKMVVGKELVFVGNISELTQEGVQIIISQGKEDLGKLEYKDEVFIYELE